MKRAFIVLAKVIAALFMVLIVLIYISQAFYNPITDLGSDYVYDEEVKEVKVRNDFIMERYYMKKLQFVISFVFCFENKKI